MIIQFIILIVFAASVIYTLFYTPLFRKVSLIYLVTGVFIISIILVPILYEFIIVTLVIDICLLVYIKNHHKNKKSDHLTKHDDISKMFIRIEHAINNLSLPYYYYLPIILFLTLTVAYISSGFFDDVYYIQNMIFSETNIAIPNFNFNIDTDSYPLIIIWILIVSVGAFFMRKILR